MADFHIHYELQLVYYNVERSRGNLNPLKGSLLKTVPRGKHCYYLSELIPHNYFQRLLHYPL